MADIAPEDIESGRLLFQRPCRFVQGCAKIEQLPSDELPEIAFAGRSNVGKSSLINALVGMKALARTSNTPGRTQEINFFDLDGQMMIADLPGYGYARAPKTQIKAWTGLVKTYLRGRVSLKRTFVLVDARHGIKDSDQRVMEMLDVAGVSYQAILTKADKITENKLESTRAKVAEVFAQHTAAHPEILATSARTGAGIPELRAALATLAETGNLQ